ncbi:MAG: radical SAM family heme chaperone HemW [Lachnospiraceae bacterium]
MKTNKLSLYVHIPFCVRKCDYCDFLSFPCGQYDRSMYLSALHREISAMGKYFAGANVDTVFIGGGTPTVCTAEELERLFVTIKSGFSLEENCEFTVEANPGTVSREKLQCLKEHGVNRISFGLQSTIDEELKKLGRIHDYATFLENFELARMVGFHNINVDLMSALPGQSVEDVLLNVKRIITLSPEHISAYSLIIEEGTPFYEIYESKSHVLGAFPEDETEREMAHLLERHLKAAGYVPYEISNYAKPGYACRHNIGYWTGHNYLGLGLGSSSMVDSARWKNTVDMKKYQEVWGEMGESHKSGLAKIDVGNANVDDEINERNAVEEYTRLTGQDRMEVCTSLAMQGRIEEYTRLTRKDRMEEFMFLGLRMHRGVSDKEFRERFGCNMFVIYKNWIEKMISQGLLRIVSLQENPNNLPKKIPQENPIIKEDYLCLTERGRDLANYVMAGFLLD